MIVRRAHEIQSGGLIGGAAGQSGNSNVILHVHTQVADYAIDARRMAVLCAWNGRQDVGLDNRHVLVDDDSWLAVPAGPATVRIRAPGNVQALTILFRVGMPEEVLGTLITAEDRMLEDGEVSSSSLPFAPHLQTHERSVTPVLMFIRRHCEMGLDDPLWYEEQLAFLLERMLLRHRQVMTRARSVPVRRAATRREILRRVSMATDFIHASYCRPLMLSDMARAAFLSRHHFLRLFKHIHDVTPHEYLQRKRTAVAARLLRSSELPITEVVKQVGFDSRSTLFRALRRFHGITPRECRHAAEAPMFMGAGAAGYGLQATALEKPRGTFAATEMG
ncbi:MAG TPA: AraC family transcriptional regulator [Steroidobacteraceae bacterium]|jgi:AraC-like DNA-binding protein